MSENYFADLYAVNVNEHTEKKNGLTYLSWAWAWAEIKKKHPDATYTIYEDDNGCFYHSDGKTAWVKTGVTVNGIEHIEYLPIMDARNRSINFDNVTSVDVNKTIQRSLTKACARHGLGLYVYAGEDLPEDSGAQSDQYKTGKPYPTVTCAGCGKEIKPTRNSKGQIQSVQDQVEFSQKTFGKDLCLSCAQKAWSGGKE